VQPHQRVVGAAHCDALGPKVVISRDRRGERPRFGLGLVAHVVRGAQAEGVGVAGLGVEGLCPRALLRV
jgi:hypothetical protein